MLTQLFSHSSHRACLIKRFIGITAFVFVVSFIAIKLAWSQPYEPAETVDLSIKFNTIAENDINIHYAYSGNQNKPGLIFIHGTPGGWAAFEGYLVSETLQNNFLMVSVDRPGWGKSETKDRKLNGVFDHQARSINAIFQQFPNKKWIVIGHSLGASLAPQVALESPDSVAGLILLAGSLSPKLGSPRWYNHAARTWVVSKLIGQTMTNANREVIKLRKQLTLMNKKLEQTKLDTNVLIVQGLKDKLVSPKNPAFALKEWPDNFLSVDVIELETAGHLIPWKQSNDVLKAIVTVANKAGLSKTEPQN